MARERADYTIPLDEGLELYENASIKAMGRLADLGVDITQDRPTRRGEYFDGRLPSNVNSLTMHELGDLYALMDLFANWLTGWVTVGKAEVQNKGEQLKLVKSRVRKSKTGTKEEREDGTIIDERYVTANAAYLEAYEYHALLDGLAEGARRDLRVISRLVETKKVQFEQGRRGSNVGERRGSFDKDKGDSGDSRPRRPRGKRRGQD
jgi:hypothetical protein